MCGALCDLRMAHSLQNLSLSLSLSPASLSFYLSAQAPPACPYSLCPTTQRGSRNNITITQWCQMVHGGISEFCSAGCQGGRC